MDKKTASSAVVDDQKQRRFARIPKFLGSKNVPASKTDDPNSPNNSATDPPPPVKSSTELQNNPKSKGRLAKILVLLFGLVVLVLVATQINHTSNKKANPNVIPKSNIVIGDTVITPQQIKEFSNQIAAYSKATRENFGGSSVQVAENDLILNAALKDQAKKHNVTVTQVDIDSTVAGKYQSQGSKAAYEQYVQSAGIGTVSKVLNENATYEAKLNDLVIAKKNLFIIYISYDSPYFNRSKDPAALRAQATNVMKTKFLTLFQKHQSEAQIAAQADLNYTGPNTPVNTQNLFFTGMPVVAYNYNNCTAANDCFNDAQGDSSIPGIVSTQSKVAELTRVGQYTNVFTSKAGFIGIMQLTGKTSGAYNSWDQLLQHYKQPYAKLLTASTSINNYVATALHNLASMFIHVDRSIGGLVLPAHAAADDPGCSAHDVTINVIASDANTGAGLSGAKVTESRSNSICGTSGGYYVDDSGQSGHRPNRMTTDGGGNASALDNCFTPIPYLLQIQPPPPSGGSVSFDHATVSSGSTSYTVNNATDFGNQFGPAAVNNPNSDISKIWAGSIVNINHGMTIHLYYNVTRPPTGGPPPIGNPSNGGVSCTDASYTAGDVVVGSRTYPVEGIIKLDGATKYGGNNFHVNDGVPMGGSHSTNIIANGQSVSMSVIEYYDQGGTIHYINGTSYPNGYRSLGSAGPCYSASCSMSIDSGLPDNDVVPGRAFTVYATIYNNSVPSDGTSQAEPIPNQLSGGTMQFQNNGGVSSFGYQTVNTGGPGFSVGNGGSISISFPATVSGGGTIVGQFAAAGQYFIGSACSAPATLYQPPTVSEGVACDSAVYGSASDPYFPGYPIFVDVYANGDSGSGTYLGRVLANGGGQSYSLAMPSWLQDGQNHTFYAYAIDPYNVENGGPATVTMTGCESFHLQPGANGGALSPSVEDPSSFDGAATVNVTYSPSNSSIYNYPGFPGVPAGVNYTITKNGGVASSGPVPSPTGNGRFNDTNYTTPALTIAHGTYVAGDTYCLNVGGGPIDGFIQNDGTVLSVSNNGPDTQSSCDVVQNRPYFTASGSSVSAGGSFASSGSCSGGGYLSSWFNNTSSTYGYGANTQLSALALVKITGFASAQSSTNLTFANSVPGDLSQDSYKPSMGGNFSPGGTYCLADASPPAGAAQVAGPYTQPGTGIAPGQNKSVFVNGDAYISGNIAYGAGWSISNVPSFVLHATGNIYISPNVTNLDGVYIAHGKIYTCADSSGFHPMAATDLYGSCNRQLTIHGSFVASQTVMTRTFGSLRDEDPVGGTPGTPGTPPTSATAGVSSPIIWSYGGPDGPPSSGYRCTPVHEQSPPQPGSTQWNDNQLCINNADAVTLGWTTNAYAPEDPGSPQPTTQTGLPNCTASWGSVVAPVGYPHTQDPGNFWWDDNYLCSNAQIEFLISPSNPDPSNATYFCANVLEPSDPYGGGIFQGTNFWKAWVCVHKYAPGSPGSPGTPGTPSGPPPLPLSCSNTPAGSKWGSCAAEIFDFSPELYLSQPAIEPPSNGATQYDAVTSLPPVL